MMKDNDWKKRLGMVYSTNPDFAFAAPEDEQPERTTPKSRQRVRVSIERKGRGGKTVTLAGGVEGTEAELAELCRQLKTKIGVGGSVKDGCIVLQGDWRARVVELLRAEGYSRAQ